MSLHTETTLSPAPSPRRASSAIGEPLSTILDAITEGVTVQDGKGAVVYANATAAMLLGFETAEALLAADAPSERVELFDERGARVTLAELPGRSTFEGAHPVARLVRFRIKETGDERWASIKSQPARSPAGEAWAVNTLRDVTDLRATEALAAEQQRRLELALAAGQMGVFEWKVRDNRVEWSDAIQRMHGIPVGSFDGTFEAYLADIHPDDLDYVLATSRRTLEQRRPHYVRYRIVRPDGQTRWLEAHGQLVLDADGDPERLVGVCRDVTEQVDAQSIEARAAAAEASRRETERARERLARILDSITDPFSVLDRDLKIVHVNDAGARVVGKTPGELIGKRALDLAPDSRETAFYRAYQRVLATGKPMTIEEHFAPRDRWYEASVYPLEDGVAIYTRDVTLRKRAIELTSRLARHSTLRAEVSSALADERDIRRMLVRCCEALVDQIDVAFARVWTLDETGTKLVLQASAGTYTHIDGGHAVVPVGKFKIGRIAATRTPHLTNDVAHDKQVGDPAWARRERMVAFAGYPMLVDGKLVGVLAMFSRAQIPEDTMAALNAVADLVAQGVVRRRAEQELEQRLADLARSNAELEQFAYVASHDLQEPLRMVASYNQLLARRYKGKLGEDADEFIGYTVEGVTRMQRLINDLLAYSRVGTRGAAREPVALDQVMADVRANLEASIAEHGASVIVDPLPVVDGDEGQLLQLMQNLVGNAIKFHGDAPPVVRVTAKTDGAMCQLAVRDNGIGIDPQYFERIFVIFQRLNPREQYPGTGIGLAISKKIVERHGGRIWVESAPGQGATVYATLPLAKGVS